MGMTKEEIQGLIEDSEHLFDWEAIDLVPKLATTIKELMAEIADSAACEADFRNRAEVAEAKLARVWAEGYEACQDTGHNAVNEPLNPYVRKATYPEVYRVEDGHTFEVSPWPSMPGRCNLCGRPATIHIPSGQIQ